MFDTELNLNLSFHPQRRSKVLYKKLDVRVGCDPELFLYSKELKCYVPAYNMVPGTKEEPYEVPKGTVQVDGTLIEIGIDPAKTREEFLNNIKTVLSWVQDHVGDQYELHCGAMIRYDSELVESLPASCFASGCDRQYVMSNLRGPAISVIHTKPVPKEVALSGGHVHIGFCKEKEIYDVAHLTDCLYVSRKFHEHFRSMNEFSTSENTRAKLMGFRREAAVRIKPYGIEYRNPSSAWLQSERAVLKMFDYAAESVLSVIDDNFAIRPCFEEFLQATANPTRVLNFSSESENKEAQDAA